MPTYDITFWDFCWYFCCCNAATRY